MTRFFTLLTSLLIGAALLLAPAGVPAQDEHDHAAGESPGSGHGEEPDGHDGESPAGHADHEDEGVVHLTAEEIAEFGLELAVAEPGRIETFVSLPGEVRPNADRLAHIVPRYSGIVIEVRANIGDHVRVGDVLAVVESDEALAPYEVRTLIDGTVIAKHVTLGEAVSRETGTFVIADLSTVWVDLSVYQRDIEHVKVGQAAQILTGHDPEAVGSISYVTPVMDEETRTAIARVVLPNPDGQWLPGMFVTGNVLIDSRDVPVAVPLTAIHTLHEHPVVFVRTDEGFVPREVRTGRPGLSRVEILAGLHPGEPYVAAGGFTLKAELGKASFGDGHAH